MKTRRVAGVFAALCLLVAPVLGAEPKYNVLLISIDTLRSDHLGCYGSKQKTPNIDAFAGKSVLFENVISQIPLTLPSHCTILTGLYPHEHGVLNNEAYILPPRVKTLAELFQANGYATGAVIGSFSLDSTFGLNQGFSSYDDRIGTGHDPETARYLERRAATVWSLGKEWMKAQKRPWFCFLHFFDPHTGYNPPEPYPQTYDGEIAYTDSVIGQVLSEQDLASTVIVILSDHGESLGEHGESSHGVFLYDATLKVPLMIHVPGAPPARVKSLARLVDVTPTIAALAGLHNLPAFSGESLIPMLHGQDRTLLAFSETYYTNLLMGWAPLRAVRSATAKWIQAPKPELYDLLHDPGEQKNLYGDKTVPKNFETEMARHGKAKSGAAEANIDPETREKLASLGYVTGSSSRPTASGMDPKDGIAVWNLIEQAVTQSQTGHFEESQKLFQDALKKDPQNVIALKFLANVLRKNGNDREAIPYLQAALKSSLHHDETQLDLARTYYDLQDDSAASREVDEILARNPKNADAKSLQARLLAHLQKDQEALRAYEELSAIRPLREEEALQAAGICLTHKDLAGADKYFRAGIAANPANPAQEYKGLALIEAVQEQWDKAIEDFLKAGDCDSAVKIVPKTNTSTILVEFERACHHP